MKKSKIITLLFCTLLIACNSEKKEEKQQIKIGGKKEEKSEAFVMGKELFKGKGNCYSCHRMDQKAVGPSLKDIMKIYREQDADIVAFLRQKAEPIVDPENYALMKTNFGRLESFSDAELEAIETYMYEVTE